MNGLGNKEIFAANLKYYIEKTGIERVALCNALDVPYTTLAGWLNAATYPRIGTLQKIADFFHVAKSDLTEDKPRNTVTFHNLTEKQMEVLELIAKVPHDKVAMIEPILREAVRLTRQ